MARQCWDADRKTEPLVNEYLAICYGKHAGEARDIFDLVEKAFPVLVYGTAAKNHALVWYRLMEPEYVLHHKLGVELAKSADNAVAVLTNATAKAQRASEAATDPIIRQRLDKLVHAVDWMRCEQACLRQVAQLTQVVERFRNTLGDDDRNALAEATQPCLEALESCIDDLSTSYRLERDDAGLYWAGNTVDRIRASLTSWRDVVRTELAR